MRKTILFIALLLLPLTYFSCESFFLQEETQQQETTDMVNVAKALIQDSQCELSLPVFHKQEVKTRSATYPTIVIPLWNESKTEWYNEEQILLVPLYSEEEIRSRTHIQKGEEESYQFSKTFSRLIVRKKGDNVIAHVITYLPESNFADEHAEDLREMGYHPGKIGFEGISLVSTLNGDFLHALLYKNGRIVSKLKTKHSTTHEHAETCTHHHNQQVRLKINLYTPSDLTTRAYNDGEETLTCIFCKGDATECNCFIVDGDIIYCEKCGNPTYECICSDFDICITCGEIPCSCYSPNQPCDLCNSNPCICGGNNGEDEEGKEGGDNEQNNNQMLPPINLTKTSNFVGWYNGANCLDLAKQTLRNYGITNYGSRANAFRLTYESNGTLLNWGNNVAQNYRNAIECINNHLSENRVLIVGVSSGIGTDINDGATDHFIVISGRGFDKDLGMCYFYFMDNATSNVEKGCHESNRLYYYEGARLYGRSAAGKNYIVTQIRPNDGREYDTTYIPNINE